MTSRIAVLTLSLGFLATPAWAQLSTPSLDESTRSMPEERGRIERMDRQALLTRIDHRGQVIGFEDGRMYRVTPGTSIFVDNQPVTIKELRPGQAVVIRAGEALNLSAQQSDGMTYGAAGGAGFAAGDMTAGPGGGLRQTIYGRVRDTDNDGTVQIEVGEDTFGKDSLKIRMSPEQARQLRKGDTVQIDVTLGAATSPATSPRTR
jgi:hypothetical protein